MTNVFEISDDEALAAGYNPIVHAGVQDADNPVVDALMGNGQQVDREGRPIISYRQYKSLAASDARLEGFAMRLGRRNPQTGQTTTGLIQASKFHKWYGQGWRPLEDLNAPKAAVQPVARPAELTGPKIYFCADKYPDCHRFFDTDKGLKFHWTKDHGEAMKRARTTPKLAPAGAEVS